MSRPELAQLTDNEIRLLFKNPMPAFVDHAAVRTVGNRLGGTDAMIAEGSPAAPRQHRYRKLAPGQLLCLLGHLRNVAVMIQAGAKVSRLPHMHDVKLKF